MIFIWVICIVCNLNIFFKKIIIFILFWISSILKRINLKLNKKKICQKKIIENATPEELKEA